MTEKENIEVATDATHPPIAAKAAAAKGKDHEVVVPPNVLEEMPRALVNRITKSALPESSLINKDAKVALAKASTVFISYLASAANELCTAGNKKSINTQHVLKALESCDLASLIPGVEEGFKQYKIFQESKRKIKGSASSAGASSGVLRGAAAASVAKARGKKKKASVVDDEMDEDMDEEAGEDEEDAEDDEEAAAGVGAADEEDEEEEGGDNEDDETANILAHKKRKEIVREQQGEEGDEGEEEQEDDNTEGGGKKPKTS